MNWPRALHVLGVVLVCGPAAPAAAYRTFANDPSVRLSAALDASPLRWEPAAPGASSQQIEAVRAGAAAALATWSAPACTSFRGELVDATAEHAAPGDGISTIEIVHEGWGARGLEPGRGAVTDVQLIVSTEGVAYIREADVYLDFEDYPWSVGGQSAFSLLPTERGLWLGWDDPSLTSATDAFVAYLLPWD